MVVSLRLSNQIRPRPHNSERGNQSSIKPRASRLYSSTLVHSGILVPVSLVPVVSLSLSLMRDHFSALLHAERRSTRSNFLLILPHFSKFSASRPVTRICFFNIKPALVCTFWQEWNQQQFFILPSRQTGKPLSLWPAIFCHRSTL